MGRVNACPFGPEIGHIDVDQPIGPADPMQFLHHPDKVVEVLNHIVRQDFPEDVVGKGVWKNIQVMDNVGITPRIDIHPNGARTLPVAASEVQHLPLIGCTIAFILVCHVFYYL